MWYQKLFRLRPFSYFLSSYTRLRERVRGKRQGREERGLKSQPLQKFALCYFFPRRAWLWGKKDDHSWSRNSSYPSCFRHEKINKPSEGKRALKNDGLVRRVLFLFYIFELVPLRELKPKKAAIRVTRHLSSRKQSNKNRNYCLTLQKSFVIRRFSKRL